MRRFVAVALVAVACSSGGSSGGGDPEAFCDRLERIAADVEDAGQGDIAADDPDEAVRFLREVADRLAEADPPAAIEDEYEVYVEAADDLAAALEGVDPSDEAATMRALTDFAQEHADDLDRGEAVSDYLGEECGVTFEDPISP